MTYAAITGWGACLPPAVLTNDDLATFLDTSDEWIRSRTGMRERRISHVTAIDLATVAARRALACAGLEPADLDLVLYASCSSDEQVPNSASGVQLAIGARRASAMDVNTACTSFLYGLSTATALVRTGVVRNAVVIGVELISPYMDWDNRNVAVLFGDGCAALVLEASDREEGVLERCGISPDRIDLVVPHQANLRIIEAVASRTGLPMEKVMLTVERYGNMSAATVPVALVEAIEQQRVCPGALILMPAFGAGLTLCAHLVRWGDRITPIGPSDAELPPCPRTALEMVNDIRAHKAGSRERSAPGLNAPTLVETA